MMSSLAAIWPLYDLTLTTPRITLRPVTDADFPGLVEAALSGVHPPGENPFSNPWAELPAEELGPGLAKWHWSQRANTSPDSWTLLLGIWHDGKIIACQDIGASNFSAVKTVTTGSWIRSSAQGQGLGKEMRAAVVLYAFDYLQAEVAESEAAAWNKQSLGVSQSLGYELNGVTRHEWGGKPEDVQKVRVTPQTFKRPNWALNVDGHAAAANFLGLAPTS